MGLIVDDHGLGIHGELRRESFSLFSDFGKEWSIELDLEQLDELIDVALRIRAERDSAKHYPQHAKFQDQDKCRFCWKAPDDCKCHLDDEPAKAHARHKKGRR